jgi:hypothetical protein
LAAKRYQLVHGLETIWQAMIIPTLSIAIVISWRSRLYMSEVCHNIAIVFRITANAFWMISEFSGFDSRPLLNIYIFNHFASFLL